MQMSKKITKIILKNWLLQRRTLSEYAVTNSIYRKTGLVVKDGPFKGMKYIENSKGGAYFPKLLGVYEKELYPIIESWPNDKFTKILNIGAGEGYYSNGFALCFRNANVVSYDPGFIACYLNEQMATINGVFNRCTIKAQLCGLNELKAELETGERTLVFMDVEGAELELLNNDAIPALNKAHIMVEIHDSLGAHLAQTITDRFKSTHTLVEINQRPRTINDLTISTYKTKLYKKAFVHSMDEGRGYLMRWFYFEPLTK